jgi:hypothetical protein
MVFVINHALAFFGVASPAILPFFCKVTEYALLWVHFVWSGIGIMAFSLASLNELKKSEARENKTKKVKNSNSGSQGLLRSQKHRLFRIAWMACAFLLSNLVAVIIVSSDLEEWALALNVWVDCQLESSSLLISKTEAYNWKIG